MIENFGEIVERGRAERERAAAVRFGILNAEQLEAALTDHNSEVRAVAVGRGLLTEAQHKRALADDAKLVRDAAKETMGGWCVRGAIKDAIWHFNCLCPWK